MARQHRNGAPYGDRVPTRDEALTAAALSFAEGLRIRDSLPVE